MVVTVNTNEEMYNKALVEIQQLKLENPSLWISRKMTAANYDAKYFKQAIIKEGEAL